MLDIGFIFINNLDISEKLSTLSQKQKLAKSWINME